METFNITVFVCKLSFYPSFSILFWLKRLHNIFLTADVVSCPHKIIVFQVVLSFEFAPFFKLCISNKATRRVKWIKVSIDVRNGRRQQWKNKNRNWNKCLLKNEDNLQYNNQSTGTTTSFEEGSSLLIMQKLCSNNNFSHKFSKSKCIHHYASCGFLLVFYLSVTWLYYKKLSENSMFPVAIIA